MKELMEKYNNLFESELQDVFPAKYYMRSEPVEALEDTLRRGFYPYNKREENIYGHDTHIPSRISIGYGSVKDNPALMYPFFGEGKVAYVLSDQVEQLKGFRPNSAHPSNSEFLVKRIPSDFIIGIITRPEDREWIEQFIFDLNSHEKSMWNFPIVSLSE